MNFLHKVLILILYIKFDTAWATDYCKLCKKGSHTMCKYKAGPSGECVEYKNTELTDELKKYIIDVHNDIRNHIASGQEIKGALGRQPSAANMNILQWDDELAAIAQRWADQCIPLADEAQHDDCKKTDRFEVGQNVLTAVTSTQELPEIAVLVLNWYKQVQNVIPSDIETFSGIQRGKFLIGQYTQLVWAETRFVGCGISTFRNMRNALEDSVYLHRLVCNYGPRGNVIGSSVYDRGIPCSKCPYGRCDTIRTSLCQGEEHQYTKRDQPHQNSTRDPTYDAGFHFNDINMEYILRNNLTEFLQKMFKDVKIDFKDESSMQFRKKQKVMCVIRNSTHYFDLNDISKVLAMIPHLKTKINITKIREDVRSTGFYIPNSNTEKNGLIKGYRKISNLLNQDRIEPFEKNPYELESGNVIIDECRKHQHLSQYEGQEEIIPNVPEEGDIYLPNNMVYKKVKGVWFHGRCRCNYVYRSAASSLKIDNYIFLIKCVTWVILQMFTFNK